MSFSTYLNLYKNINLFIIALAPIILYFILYTNKPINFLFSKLNKFKILNIILIYIIISIISIFLFKSLLIPTLGLVESDISLPLLMNLFSTLIYAPIFEELAHRYLVKDGLNINMYYFGIIIGLIINPIINTVSFYFTILKLSNVENNLNPPFIEFLHSNLDRLIKLRDYQIIEFANHFKFIKISPDILSTLFYIIFIIIILIIFACTNKKILVYKTQYKKLYPILTTTFVFSHFTPQEILVSPDFNDPKSYYLFILIRIVQLSFLSYFFLYFRIKMGIAYSIIAHFIFNAILLIFSFNLFKKNNIDMLLYALLVPVTLFAIYKLINKAHQLDNQIQQKS